MMSRKQRPSNTIGSSDYLKVPGTTITEVRLEGSMSRPASVASVLAGGLCENGFNHQSFLPGPEPPTGEQGCVYKYGKATMVKLDDVAAWHG